MEISMGDAVAASKSGKYDLDDIFLKGSTPLWWVCVKEGHKASRCEKVKDIASFMKDRYWSFSYGEKPTNRGSRQVALLTTTVEN